MDSSLFVRRGVETSSLVQPKATTAKIAPVILAARASFYNAFPKFFSVMFPKAISRIVTAEV